MKIKKTIELPDIRSKEEFLATQPMALPTSGRPDEVFTGFPDLNYKDEDLATRPMPLHEIPIQARIDREMDVINRHHERIAKAINTFWGHRDCVEYIQKLILNGGDGAGNARVGFKSEVLAALINLTVLHDEKFGS
jgi:hypothetical protein